MNKNTVLKLSVLLNAALIIALVLVCINSNRIIAELESEQKMYKSDALTQEVSSTDIDESTPMMVASDTDTSASDASEAVTTTSTTSTTSTTATTTSATQKRTTTTQKTTTRKTTTTTKAATTTTKTTTTTTKSNSGDNDGDWVDGWY